MKLFYMPGACSLASHIMLHEVGADFEVESVDTKAGRTQSGLAFREISPNGYVPTLEIEPGIFLNEGASILQFIADTHPDQAFSPENGSIARARLQQFLNFAAAELHKSWSPLFADTSSEEEKETAKRKVASKFDYLESALADGRDYLVDNQFSAADAYTFVLCIWSGVKNIDLAPWPKLAQFVERVKARPATQAAMTAEGLL